MARIRFKTGESIKENDENIPNTVELEVIDGKFQHIVDLEAIDEEMAEPLKSASSFLQESPLVKKTTDGDKIHDKSTHKIEYNLRKY